MRYRIERTGLLSLIITFTLALAGCSGAGSPVQQLVNSSSTGNINSTTPTASVSPTISTTQVTAFVTGMNTTSALNNSTIVAPSVGMLSDNINKSYANVPAQTAQDPIVGFSKFDQAQNVLPTSNSNFYGIQSYNVYANYSDAGSEYNKESTDISIESYATFRKRETLSQNFMRIEFRKAGANQVRMIAHQIISSSAYRVTVDAEFKADVTQVTYDSFTLSNQTIASQEIQVSADFTGDGTPESYTGTIDLTHQVLKITNPSSNVSIEINYPYFASAWALTTQTLKIRSENAQNLIPYSQAYGSYTLYRKKMEKAYTYTDPRGVWAYYFPTDMAKLRPQIKSLLDNQELIAIFPAVPTALTSAKMQRCTDINTSFKGVIDSSEKLFGPL